MSTDRTILEGQSPEPPPGPGLTVRESQASTAAALQSTLLENQPLLTPRSAAAAFNLAPGADFLAYRLVEPIRVASGEAMLWLADRKADGQRIVVKVYQYNVRPKAEIVSKLRHISKAQVIEVLESGVLEDGRHYEILEYAVHGTLGDLISRGPVPEARMREVLRELADALVELHAANILHRDIKPANILVRSLEPLDLVLTDFGISSVSDLSMHATSVSRTAAYSAPEAMTGVVAKASDWWSLGVIMLELLTSRQWCSGMDERQVNFQLVSRGIAVPTNLPGAWVTLLKGLLTRDHAKRWGTEQVRGWLSGRRDLAVHYEVQSSTALDGRSAGLAPYPLGGKEYYTAEDLAVGLAENWEEGKKRLARGRVLAWLTEAGVKYEDQINGLQEIAAEPRLDENFKLSAAILALHPDLPLLWRGEVISPEWLVTNVPTAVGILANSTIPDYLKRFRSQTWLEELRERRTRLWSEIKRVGIPVEANLAETLILGPPNRLAEEANLLQQTLGGAKEPRLEALIHKQTLSEAEAIVLLACDRNLLQTKVHLWNQEFNGATQQLDDLVRQIQNSSSLRQASMVELEVDQLEQSIELQHTRLSQPVTLQDDHFEEFLKQIQECRTKIASRERWLRRKVQLKVVSIVGMVLGIAVLIFHTWMVSSTKIYFQLNADGEAVTDHSFARIFIDGKAVQPGTKIAWGTRLLSLDTNLYVPFQKTLHVSYGKQNHLGNIPVRFRDVTVSITSIPPGAEFKMLTSAQHREINGNTPAVITNLLPGRFSVTFGHEDYEGKRLEGELAPPLVKVDVELKHVAPATAADTTWKNTLNMEFKRIGEQPARLIHDDAGWGKFAYFEKYLEASSGSIQRIRSKDRGDINQMQVEEFCRWLTTNERQRNRIGPLDRYRIATRKETDSYLDSQRKFWLESAQESALRNRKSNAKRQTETADHYDKTKNTHSFVMLELNGP